MVERKFILHCVQGCEVVPGQFLPVKEDLMASLYGCLVSARMESLSVSVLVCELMQMCKSLVERSSWIWKTGTINSTTHIVSRLCQSCIWPTTAVHEYQMRSINTRHVDECQNSETRKGLKDPPWLFLFYSRRTSFSKRQSGCLICPTKYIVMLDDNILPLEHPMLNLAFDHEHSPILN